MLYVIARKTKAGAVEIYKPASDGKISYLFVTFDRDNSNKPTYRNKYVTLNCFKYRIMWDKA